MEEDRKFDTGARRSKDADATRFDLISPIAMDALARVCAEGAEKYADMNWELGMPVHDLLNHVEAHINKFKAGDRSEPHLEHALWGMHAAVHSMKMWPHLNASHLRGPGCTLTEANKECIRKQLQQNTARRKAAAQSSWDNYL